MVLAHSRLVALGAPREIVTPALLADVYGVRARVEVLDGDQPHVIVEGSVKHAA
jgi:iron complex transport system ATP-binding protein